MISSDDSARLRPISAAPNDSFGYAVAASGQTIMVGAPGKNLNQGAIYLFSRRGATWTQDAEFTAHGVVSLGQALALQGTTAVVSGPSATYGTVYVFVSTDGVRRLQASLPYQGPNTFFGTAVALSGNTLAASATGWARSMCMCAGKALRLRQ